MGVDLRPIIVSDVIRLDELEGRIITVDASNILHQFLSTIRQPDGAPLTDSEGNVTSHLVGLFYRTLKLMELSIRPVYVFDGEMPDLKTGVVEERARKRREAEQRWEEAKRDGKTGEAFRQAVRRSYLDEQMIRDAKILLGHLGLPTVQAPGEAEAQCAYMTREDEVFAMNSRDYDSLLFGAQRLLRYLTIKNRENIEVIVLDRLLGRHGLSFEQLVDMGVLIGTDYNEGVFRVGPKTALKLIKKHGSIEDLPERYLEKLDDGYREVRDLFLDPPVTSDYHLAFSEPDKNELVRFLCEERGFPRERVLNNLYK